MIRFLVVGAGLFGGAAGWWIGSAAEFKAALAGAIMGVIIGVVGMQETYRLLKR
ncbi:MAG: hypothetical protein NTW19_09435 [Planctomycetota bacterium]|nr:hypothetical protein [Planctomycetota bacterium]